MKIALTKMNQVWEDKLKNIGICNQISNDVSDCDVNLLIFPEMTLTGFSLNTKLAEDYESSLSLKYFSNLAISNNYTVVAGLVLRSTRLTENLALAFNPKGKVVCKYAKIHPFSPGKENLYISKGSSPSFFKCSGIKFGLTICYDLRFPSLWDAIADKCDCIINIANWPANRVDHWISLLKARAIENQLYVIGVNRVGLDGNQLKYEESSYCFAPDGGMLNPIHTKEQFDIIEIEKKIVTNYRNFFPVRCDRRTNLYIDLLKAN